MDPSRVKALPLFASLTDEQAAAVGEWAEERGLAAGDCVGWEGATGYSFYVIEDGTAEVTRDGEALRELGAGDFFGEIAILEGGRRTATVTATSQLRLLAFHGTDVRRMQAELPDVAARVEAEMAARRSGS